MHAHIRLGRLFGIEIGLHLSWLLIAVLIALSLASHFRALNPEWAGGVAWAAALITAFLFFFGIVVHELSHALVARARGLPTRRITLFALGGVAQIEKESAEPSTEFLVAIAGPITSVLIGLLCLGGAFALGWAGDPTAVPESPVVAILVWLGLINIALAIFNMIPGYPLDGGRVLRSLLWWKTGSMERGTKQAARVGQVVALGFILLGVFQFFATKDIGRLWLAIIGWFLLEAAGASYAHVAAVSGLRGLKVRDLMSRDCAFVDPTENLQAFVDDYLLRSGRRCFLVVGNGTMHGLVTPKEVSQVAREEWPRTTVRQVMRPMEQLRTVAPETLVTDALEVMTREDLNQLPVVLNGRLEGVLSRGHVLQLLQARADLKV